MWKVRKSVFTPSWHDSVWLIIWMPLWVTALILSAASWLSPPPPSPPACSCSCSWFPPWAGCPIAALPFWWSVVARHHPVGHRRLCAIRTNPDGSLPARPGAHQTLTSAIAVVLLTLLIASYVRRGVQKALCLGVRVEMFTVEQTPPRLIDKAGVNIWSELLCQSPGTGWSRMSRQLTQLFLNHHMCLYKRMPRLRASECHLLIQTPLKPCRGGIK